MMFLSILAGATLVAAAVGRHSTWRTHLRRGLAAAMAVAGAAHLAQPDPFVAHLPDWVPAREAIVALTGVVEIVFGAALVWPARNRRRVGMLLVAYLVAVFPANVYVAVAAVDVDGQPGGVYSWLRLPVQALLVWIAHWTTTAAMGESSTATDSTPATGQTVAVGCGR